ncbi:MAG: PaaX family transcriptional regulator C-terminal domain-containing protein [Lacisediminihabitans sp.]
MPTPALSIANLHVGLESPKTRQGSPTSLLLTLFGDYWLERSEPFPSGALVALLKNFDVSEVAARAALSRMVRRGLLVSSKVGRNTSYLLAPRSVNIVRRTLARIGEFGLAAGPWRGTWSVVIVSDPGSRTLRNALRRRLHWLGFAPLEDDVWISPRDRHEAAVEELAALGITCVTALTATVPPTAPGGRRPQEAWDLEALAQAYQRFVEEAEELSHAVKRGELAPAEALVRRTRLSDEWIDLSGSDPDLPRVLLPHDWPRSDARAAFAQAHEALAALAVARVSEVLAASDPQLAPFVVHRTFVL